MAHRPRSPAAPGDRSAPDPLADAFRALHGRRLHGFALLLTLGDRRLAAGLADDALAAGAARAEELRHPERAAAWLRARVLRALPRRHRPVPPAEERAALEALAVDPSVVDGLAALAARERAALITADIERLDRRDVETIAGRQGAGLERLLATARRRYLAGATAAPTGGPPGDGSLVQRIRSVAARTMA